MLLPNLVQSALIATKLAELQRPSAGVRPIDLTFVPPNKESTYGSRDPLKVIDVVVHVTDVKGGYGIAKYQIDKQRALYRKGLIDARLLDQLPNPNDLETSFRLLALWARYANEPYHWIGARNGTTIHNHITGLRTAHGNWGNRGVGWAADCGRNEPMDAGMLVSFQQSLQWCIEQTYQDNGGQRIRITPHRAYSKARRPDPNRNVWLHIVKPVVTRLTTQAYLDYDHFEDTGLPVPNTWDPDARYDAKGKRL